MNHRYSVAICTFNGAAFLRQQLDSILSQTTPADEIVIVDDKSTDATATIIKEYCQKFPHIFFYQNKIRLGIFRNFEKALGLCRGEFIFLSDQDDVWRPDKIVTFDKKLKELSVSGEDTALLLFSDLEVVDENLKLIYPSWWKFLGYKPSSHSVHKLKKLILQNFVTGATSLVSRKLVEVALPFPEQCIMHDYWLALVAAQYGQLIEVDQPLVYYRQHSNNADGCPPPIFIKIFDLIVKHGRSLFFENKNISRKLNQLNALLDRPTSLPPTIKAAELHKISTAIKTGGFCGLRLVIKENVLPMKLPMKLAFLLDLCLNPLRNALHKACHH